MSATHHPAEPTRDPPAQRSLRYRGYRLDGAIEDFYHAVDTLERDSVPYAYYLKVLAGRDQLPAERAPSDPER